MVPGKKLLPKFVGIQGRHGAIWYCWSANLPMRDAVLSRRVRTSHKEHVPTASVRIDEFIRDKSPKKANNTHHFLLQRSSLNPGVRRGTRTTAATTEGPHELHPTQNTPRPVSRYSCRRLHYPPSGTRHVRPSWTPKRNASTLPQTHLPMRGPRAVVNIERASTSAIKSTLPSRRQLIGRTTGRCCCIPRTYISVAI